MLIEGTIPRAVASLQRSSTVQRPVPSGGRSLDNATIRAICSSENLAGAPGRGASYKALSSPPSKNRLRTFATLATEQRTCSAMALLLSPCSALSRIWQRRTNRAGCDPLRRIVSRNDRCSSVSSRLFAFFMGGRLGCGTRRDGSIWFWLSTTILQRSNNLCLSYPVEPTRSGRSCSDLENMGLNGQYRNREITALCWSIDRPDDYKDPGPGPPAARAISWRGTLFRHFTSVTTDAINSPIGAAILSKAERN